MEQKTDLSGEFGRPSVQARKEFEADRTSEFIHPPEENTPLPDPALQDNEFTPLPSSKGTAPKTNKHKKHRRTLLLQMAAVGLGAVIITNSFGGDILGRDTLFSSSVSESTGQFGDPIPSEEASQSGSLYITQAGNKTPVFLCRNGQATDAQVSGLSYDSVLNRLELDDYSGGQICAEGMGLDFTIYVKGENHVDQITVSGVGQGLGSLTIDGTFKSILTINENQNHAVGLLLNANNTSNSLTVTWHVDVDVYGSDAAILLSRSTDEIGIYCEPVTRLSGEIIHSDNTLGAADWTISAADNNNTPATHVSFDDTFKMERETLSAVHESITLYQNAPYGDPFVNTSDINAYSIITNETPITVTNICNSAPIYIYYTQYTNHDEPYPVAWVQDEIDWESSDTIPTVDLQGKYYSGGGIAYLATDGETLSWNWDFVINSNTFPSDAVTLAPGESITFTLPDDGSNSIYQLFSETYFPESERYYWIYSTFKFDS